MSKSLLLKPRVSEKGYVLSDQHNTYMFDIPEGANKHIVAKAVAAQYGVKVNNVRLANVAGKSKRAYLGRGKFAKAKRSNTRRAYVTLAASDKLPIYAAVDEEVKAERKEKK